MGNTIALTPTVTVLPDKTDLVEGQKVMFDGVEYQKRLGEIVALGAKGGGGVFVRNIRSISAGTYQVTINDNVLRCLNPGIVVTLLDATDNYGIEFIIKNESSGEVTVNTLLSQTIDGYTEWTVKPLGVITVVCDGVNYLITSLINSNVTPITFDNNTITFDSNTIKFDRE